jgi:GNAT superfamily N-acetyltransferase
MNDPTNFNALTHPDPAASPMVLAIHNENSHLIAGLVGRSAYGWLRIDIIWVATESRNQGIGSRLLREAEEIALERGCRGVHLDTHAFQAPAFYEKRSGLRT